MIIDGYTHVMPKNYYHKLLEKAPANFYISQTISGTPSLFDLGARIEMMDEFGVDAEVITMAAPPPELVCPREAPELVRLANEEMAEIVAQHPGRFIGVGAVAMNCPEKATAEVERIVRLGLKGVLLYTSIEGRPLDDPGLDPLFAAIDEYGLPIWLHPLRGENRPDYPREDSSKYVLWIVLGWPYESTLAQARLVLSGTLDKYPGLKIIIHHGGGMIPFYAQRFQQVFQSRVKTSGVKHNEALKEPVENYFRRFYVDTAVSGSLASAQCMYSFYGSDHIIFGSDGPFDAEDGRVTKRDSLSVVKDLPIPQEEKDRIFQGNLMKLISCVKV